MSTSWSGNMRRIPLLLLLLLLTALGGTVLGQDDGADPDTEPQEEETADQGSFLDVDTKMSEPTISVPDPPSTSELSPTDGEENTDEGGSAFTPENSVEVSDPTSSPLDNDTLSPLIILIPVALVVLIIAMIVFCIFLKRRWRKETGNQDSRKEDPYLFEDIAEKVPMPMFEEDVPSVLELEMEELDQWMKKDADGKI